LTTLVVRQFSAKQDYQAVWKAMQVFTGNRESDTPDELWLLEHLPVYTQGQAGKAEHVLNTAGVPVVQSDRGGQITWHGPGQLMIYTLLDHRRLHLGASALVHLLEQTLINVLGQLGIRAYARTDAPGVYVGLPDQREAKIAALGLRLRKNGCYHGAALNIDCDLAAFANINPCGHPGMAVTRLTDVLSQPFVCVDIVRADIEQALVVQLAQALQYQHVQRISCDD
jgi:lipoyl(octanoyl) transferase